MEIHISEEISYSSTILLTLPFIVQLRVKMVILDQCRPLFYFIFSFFSLCHAITFLLFAYRKCNCDAAELQWRRDGGVINSTSKLPVKTLNFMDSQREEAQGIITLGKLYCAQVDFGMIWRTFSTMNIHVCTLIFKWRKIWFKYH